MIETFIPAEVETIRAVRWDPASKDSIRDMVELTSDAYDICLEVYGESQPSFCVKADKLSEWVNAEGGEWMIRHPNGAFEAMPRASFSTSYRKEAVSE